MSLPVVRRTTYDAAMAKAAEVEAELHREMAAVRETLDRAREDHDAALADRDRVAAALARARAEADRFAAIVAEKQAELAQAAKAFEAQRIEARQAQHQAASEAKAREETQIALVDTQSRLEQTARRLEDFRSETERLGAQLAQVQAVHRADVEALERTAGERDRFAARLSDFEGEAKRLGNQVLGVIEENRVLSSGVVQSQHAEREAYVHLAACTRDPLLIGTFPRSGTWMLRYFLCLLDRLSTSKDLPPVREIFARASASEFHFDYDRPEHKSQRIALSHWMCPGSIELAEKHRPDLIELLRSGGSLEYQRKKDADHAGFRPSNGARIIFVYRSPLDVYRSYADLFERRSAMPDRKQYPFNPMVPWGTDLMNTTSEQPFEFFIDNLLNSGFAEFFVSYFTSFLLVRDAFPDRVLFLKYEDAMRDRSSYLRKIVDFGRIGSPGVSTEAFDRALAATEIGAMKRYEAELGHAISGESTFYGERNQTHLSVKKRDLNEVFSEELAAQFRARIAQLDPRVLEYLPE